MPKRENRREHILAVAADNFMENGYYATSIRQIAQIVGVSEAAIYYHFKGGKRELLQCVVELAEMDLRAALKFLDKADSLHNLFLRYGEGVMRNWRGPLHRTVRWVISEMPHLTQDERVTFYAALFSFHEALAAKVQRFVSNPSQAMDIAWLLICTSFGYRQVFFDLEVESMVELSITPLLNFISEGLPVREMRPRTQDFLT